MKKLAFFHRLIISYRIWRNREGKVDLVAHTNSFLYLECQQKNKSDFSLIKVI